jgi:hypothetical protein
VNRSVHPQVFKTLYHNLLKPLPFGVGVSSHMQLLLTISSYIHQMSISHHGL